MIKYLDDFYKEIYDVLGFFKPVSYDDFIENIFFYAKYYPILSCIEKYPIILLVFEKYYCQYGKYKEHELVDFIADSLILEYENKIIYELRMHKLDKLLAK